MKGAELVHVVSFLPEKVIVNETFYQQLLAENKIIKKKGELEDEVFFKGVEERRFASPDYTSIDLGEKVIKKLIHETELNPQEIDLIICSCIFTDTYWPGIATAVQHRIHAKNTSIMNIDTSCASFLTGVNIAMAFIESGKYEKIVVITVTNFISRLAEFQISPRSFVLGDGATAALVVKGKKNIISSVERSYGEHYGLMRFEPEVCDTKKGNYWERDSGPITVNFDSEMIKKIRSNAMVIVPNAVEECLKQAKLTPDDINLLITHQPNQFFLNEWREKIGITPPRVHDTLRKYGNLFQGSIPVTLADAIENKILKNNDLVALGTFSNGGDFASAMIFKYQ